MYKIRKDSMIMLVIILAIKSTRCTSIILAKKDIPIENIAQKMQIWSSKDPSISKDPSLEGVKTQTL